MQLHAALVPDVNHFIEERLLQFQATAEKRGVALKLSLDPRLRDVSLYLDT